MEEKILIDQLHRLALNLKDTTLADAIVAKLLRYHISPRLSKMFSEVERLSGENEQLKDMINGLEEAGTSWLMAAKKFVVEYLSEYPEKYEDLSEDSLRRFVDNFVDENHMDIVNCVAEYDVHNKIDYSEWLDELIFNKPKIGEEESTEEDYSEDNSELMEENSSETGI